MADTYSLYTNNGVPVANKLFEKVIFKHGLSISPVDLIAFQDTIIRDFDNFLFATRGQINGVYKTEYNIETQELIAGLDVSIQEASVLSPTSNYELKINRGKAYIGGKLVVVPLNDYVEVPDNDIYSDPITLHVILERNEKYFEPTAIGEPGYAIIDGRHTADRYEAGYTLRIVDTLPTELDENGSIQYLQLATLYKPPILKIQSNINLNKMDGDNDEGINWTKYESPLHILNVEKVMYFYSAQTITKIPSTITQAQWNSLNSSTLDTTLTSGIYYVPYTKNVLIVHSDVRLFSQERIWYMPHTAGLELTDERFIMEDLPTVINAAFKAVNDIVIHKTNFFEGYIPYGLNENHLTPGPTGIIDNTTPDYNPDGKTFWVLPIAESEDIIVYKDGSIASGYTVTNVEERTYIEDGKSITKELGKIVFNTAPASGDTLTVDYYHDSHTLYVENAKHEDHRNDIDAHPNYINNDEFSEHLLELNDTPGNIETVLAHDNRYYTKNYLDDTVTGKSDKDHHHDDTYSLLGHEHQISEVDELQDQLVKLEGNIGVFNKTTRLIFEQIEEGVDGLRDHFIIDSSLMNDETAKLVGVRADLTGDDLNNPVILEILRNPYNITGRVDSLPNNYTIQDNHANFPTDNSIVGKSFIPNIETYPNNSFIIQSNTINTITLTADISSFVEIPFGINPGSRYIIDPHTITDITDNYTIKDTSANFPIDNSWVNGNLQVLDNSNTWHVFKIISNDKTSITVDSDDINSYTAIGKIYLVNDFTEGGINPWSEPQKVSFGGNNLGLVVSAVQTDDEIWSLWVDTIDSGITNTLWWSTRKIDDNVWSPPSNTNFSVDNDCRPSIVLLPNQSTPLNEDLLWLFTDNHNVYRSYVTYGQTNYTDPELFFDLTEDIHSPQGRYIQRNGNNEIWLVYTKIDNGYTSVFLQRFYTNEPYSGITGDKYSRIGNEIKLSSNTKNCYQPTISQELAANGNIWIAWGEDNSSFDNRKQPLLTILDINNIEVVAPNYIPNDIATFLSNFNNESKMEIHHSADGNVWFVYSVLEGGGFRVYYTLLEYDISTNSVKNLTPPVSLSDGHEVSITERSDKTIWINYNQATQVYSQVRTLGNGEVKWTRSNGELITEKPIENDTFLELRWQLPFVNIESRLEAVESTLITYGQKLEELENRIKEYHEFLLNSGTDYIDDNNWRLPSDYVESKASNLRIFRQGLRLQSNLDWSLVGNIITFTDSTPISNKIIVEWNQLL